MIVPGRILLGLQILLCHYFCRSKQVEGQLKKPKRGIAPTQLKSQPASSTVSSEMATEWNEPISHQAFVNSDVQSLSDLKQALKADRREIEKEIISRRCCKHEAGEREALLSKMSDKQEVVEGRTGSCGEIKVASRSEKQYRSSESSHFPSSVMSFVELQVSDLPLLDQLAKLYSEVIKGLFLAVVYSEQSSIIRFMTITFLIYRFFSSKYHIRNFLPSSTSYCDFTSNFQGETPTR